MQVGTCQNGWGEIIAELSHPPLLLTYLMQALQKELPNHVFRMSDMPAFTWSIVVARASGAYIGDIHIDEAVRFFGEPVEGLANSFALADPLLLQQLVDRICRAKLLDFKAYAGTW